MNLLAFDYRDGEYKVSLSTRLTNDEVSGMVNYAAHTGNGVFLMLKGLKNNLKHRTLPK